MKGIVDLDRRMRLMQTEGTPLHTIIEKRLVCKDDWVTFCGATYRDQSGRWIKHRDGSMQYIGFRPK